MHYCIFYLFEAHAKSKKLCNTQKAVKTNKYSQQKDSRQMRCVTKRNVTNHSTESFYAICYYFCSFNNNGYFELKRYSIPVFIALFEIHESFNTFLCLQLCGNF